MIGNTILLAMREIRRNIMRSFLTMLGIVIGVGAVITMVTIGGGATVQVTEQIASLGSNLLMVTLSRRVTDEPLLWLWHIWCFGTVAPTPG